MHWEIFLNSMGPTVGIAFFYGFEQRKTSAAKFGFPLQNVRVCVLGTDHFKMVQRWSQVFPYAGIFSQRVPFAVAKRSVRIFVAMQ